MKVIDAGHWYELQRFDIAPSESQVETLVFVKRYGPGYPGNLTSHSGTLIQEVLRALIDRIKYVHNQIPAPENIEVLKYFRHSLFLLEKRAAQRHGKELIIISDVEIEDLPTGANGHLLLGAGSVGGES